MPECGCFASFNGKNMDAISKTPILRSFLIKIDKFDPRGVNKQGPLLLFGNLF